MAQQESQRELLHDRERKGWPHTAQFSVTPSWKVLRCFFMGTSFLLLSGSTFSTSARAEP